MRRIFPCLWESAIIEHHIPVFVVSRLSVFGVLLDGIV
jgi:hypothetical protein